MIPELQPGSGHLPPGRYLTTLKEVEERFVSHPDFASSLTREAIWNGFLSYLYAWSEAEKVCGVTVLRSMWFAGSFISDEADPSDIDVTPVLDAVVLESCKGRAGVGQLKSLFGHRESIRKEFRVEPFVIPWRALESVISKDDLLACERAYLMERGGWDDLWQRVRPDKEIKGPLTVDSAPPRRGYLEVIFDA